jgi:hypothetical protein
VNHIKLQQENGRTCNLESLFATSEFVLPNRCIEYVAVRGISGVSRRSLAALELFLIAPSVWCFSVVFVKAMQLPKEICFREHKCQLTLSE